MSSPQRWYIGGSGMPLKTLPEMMATKLGHQWHKCPDWLKDALKEPEPLTRKQAIDRHNQRILNDL